MPKRDVEGELESLTALRQAGATEATVAVLRKALRDRVNLVVAKAAALTGELGIRSLLPELRAAYDRLFIDAAKRDSQCWAKKALAQAMKDLQLTDSEPFVRGAQHHQWEPVWGSEVDTAGTLRSTCVLALPFCTDLLREEKLWHLMRGLTDAMAGVRLDAARGLAQIGGFEAALLLRLKARMPEADMSVVEQVFESLLEVEREAAVPFALEFVTQRGQPERNVELAEQAALALGASRLPAAAEALIQCWRDPHLLHCQDVVLRAIGISRVEAGVEFLFNLLQNGREREGLAALSALELHRGSTEIVTRIQAALEQRNSPAMLAAFQRLFSTKL